MLCVVIKGPTWEEVRQQTAEASSYADSVELRLDLFSHVDQEALKQLRRICAIPMIFTLRPLSQGGGYPHSEENRLSLLRQLAALKPAYLDLEYDIPPFFIEEIAASHPEIKIILSYHNFMETPADLDSLYTRLRCPFVHFYKIAVMACSTVDTLRLLLWAQEKNERIIAISMGSYGQLSRILCPILGIPMTYASLDDGLCTAPGQLSAKVLKERYRFFHLTPRTKIYGLIGDPVDSSISDVTHNALMTFCGIDAVYIKIHLKASELAEFFPLAKRLPLQGLSVTMPLKEAVIPFLDEIDLEAEVIGAVNTLLFKPEGNITGYNTDGRGALNAIEKSVAMEGKRVTILGAGGAARAIAYEASKRGALVTIINRNAERACQAAKRLSCSWGNADANYDLLVNATPAGMPILPERILPHTLVMDIKTMPKETEFTQEASKKGCPVIYGYQMFIEQAAEQFHLWFGAVMHPQNMVSFLDKESIAILNQKKFLT